MLSDAPNPNPDNPHAVQTQMVSKDIRLPFTVQKAVICVMKHEPE